MVLTKRWRPAGEHVFSLFRTKNRGSAQAGQRLKMRILFTTITSVVPSLIFILPVVAVPQLSQTAQRQIVSKLEHGLLFAASRQVFREQLSEFDYLCLV